MAEKTCPQCGGTGEIDNRKDGNITCGMCGGSGTVPA